MKISVIIPCFNAVDKIGRCLASLRSINFSKADYEVLFVDDCSTDGTHELIQQECSYQINWRALRLPSNSGSPSRPRNLGIELAKGNYLYFLDCDDELLPDALNILWAHAQSTDACIVRSELWADSGNERKRMNRVPNWSSALTLAERRELIITRTSTVTNSFVKRSLLLQNNIRWNEHLRMGEDTVFLAEVLLICERIEYLPEPTFVYFKVPALTPSSTQRYGRRELNNHLYVWTTVQKLMLPIGIDYIKGRLPVGLRVALENLIFRNHRDIDEISFGYFHKFVESNWDSIGGFSYTRRLSELLQTIKGGNYKKFQFLCRPRLLIAGHDLKFIRDSVSVLEEHFDIRFDEWTGHETHDEKQSKALLDWAEYIWCEWLLKNAEWYAAHKRPEQRLVIRMHRMELGRTHGERFDIGKVDAVIAVSPFFLERLLERYPAIPRCKTRFIPNYVCMEDYRRDWHPDRLHTLGIIGILPSRKGYLRALQILQSLREIDPRFRLEVFGARPADLTWVARDKKEMEYFSACENFIQKNRLQDAININGHVDIKKALAERRVGYVLSVSDSDHRFPGPESFHLAVADSFAGGSVPFLMHWPGSEFIWPEKCISWRMDDLIGEILMHSQSENMYKSAVSDGYDFVSKQYAIQKFVDSVVEILHDYM